MNETGILEIIAKRLGIDNSEIHLTSQNSDKYLMQIGWFDLYAKRPRSNEFLIEVNIELICYASLANK